MKIDTKYSIGDAVYFLDGYRIQCANIVAVRFEKHGESRPCITYLFAIYPMRNEEECFPTKESLIKYISR